MMRGMKSGLAVVIIVFATFGLVSAVWVTSGSQAPTGLASPQTAVGTPLGPLTNDELALALGDQPDAPAGTHVDCAARSGRTPSEHVFNRVCWKVFYESWLCIVPTGQTRQRLFVKVTGKRYKALRAVSVGKYEECEVP
jgi:hypothetical protein